MSKGYSGKPEQHPIIKEAIAAAKIVDEHFVKKSTERKGKEITIQEMPQGCFITQDRKTIQISSKQDAALLIHSLSEMIGVWFERWGEDGDH